MVLSNLLYIEKKDLPAGMVNHLIRLAAFQNPEFYKAQAMRLSTFGKPRVIGCAEDFPVHIGLPGDAFQKQRSSCNPTVSNQKSLKNISEGPL